MCHSRILIGEEKTPALDLHRFHIRQTRTDPLITRHDVFRIGFSNGGPGHISDRIDDFRDILAVPQRFEIPIDQCLRYDTERHGRRTVLLGSSR